MQLRPPAINTANLLAFVLRHRVGISIITLALLLDEAAKLAVVRMRPVGESWPTAGFFHLTHAINVGSTMDLFSGHTIALIIASALCTLTGLLLALYWPRPKTGARPQVAFGLMLAGGAGNLVGRVAFGHVVDFIDILPWFILNVADMAILRGQACTWGYNSDNTQIVVKKPTHGFENTNFPCLQRVRGRDQLHQQQSGWNYNRFLGSLHNFGEWGLCGMA